MKRLACVFAAAMLLTSCAGEDGPVTTDVDVATESSVEGGTDVTYIDLEVGVSTGATVSQTVPRGSNVRISITNPAEDDEYHLHGYDVSSGEVPAGETATIEFFADAVGSFELESHHSGDLLMTLVVE